MEMVQRAPKRPLEPGESEDYRWGNVRQTGKRSRTGGVCLWQDCSRI